MISQTRWSVQIKVEGVWQLYAEGPSLTSNLEFSESIYSSFATGTWMGNFGSSLFENNVISVGTELLFIVASLDYGQKPIRLSVLSIDMPMGPGDASPPSVYVISLVSPWYFSQSVTSKAYYGLGHEIIKDALSSIDTASFDKELVVSNSIGSPNKRYQTFQTPEKFIRSRVLPFTQGVLNSSFFLLGNLQGGLEALSYEDIRLKGSTTFISLTHPDYQLYASKALELFDPPGLAVLVNYGIKINTSPESQLWHLTNAKLIALNAYQTPLLQDSTTSVLPRLGRDIFRNRFSPVKETATTTQVGKPFIDETLQSPSTILSYNLYMLSNLLMREHVFPTVVETNFSLQSGRIASLKVLNGEGLASKYSQDFLITGISHSISYTGETVTTCYLGTTSFKYSDEEDVKGLVHIEK